MNNWVVVVGGTNMDVVARTSARLVPATSNPGHTRISPGGVGRNIASCLGLLGAPVRLVSAVGDDTFGDEALRVTAASGADVGAVRRVPGAATGTYTAVLDDSGELPDRTKTWPPEGKPLEGLPPTVEAIVPSYLWRFRRTGQFKSRTA